MVLDAPETGAEGGFVNEGAVGTDSWTCELALCIRFVSSPELSCSHTFSFGPLLSGDSGARDG